MHAFGKLALVQTKLYLREPMSVFFTLCFGPIMLVIMGFIFGSLPRTELGGMSQMDLSTTSFIALILGITGLTSVPIVTATRREMGVLRRFAATPLRPLVYFLSDILAPFGVTLLGVLILILMGVFLYDVTPASNWISLLGAVSLSALAFFALGYAIAGLVRNTRTAIVLGNVIVIPMVIFSGAMVPMEVMPASIVSFSRFIPLRHVVTLVQGVWFGEGWAAHWVEAAVLAGMLVVSMAVVALTFKWE